MKIQTLAARILNNDDEANQVKPNEGIVLLNGRATPNGLMIAVDGHEQIDDPHLSAGECLTISSVTDAAGRYLVKFNYSSTGAHNITLYWKATGAVYMVLDSTATDNKLNFSPDYLITAEINNDVLIWNDGLNPTSSIELGPAMNRYDTTQPLPAPFTYAASIPESSFRLPWAPPPVAPVWSKIATVAQTSLIGTQSYQFATDYLRYNGSSTTLSPWSTATKLNSRQENEQNLNTIRITVPGVPGVEVRKKRLWCKRDNTTFLIKEWDREDAGNAGIFAGTTPAVFDFFGNVAGEVMSLSDALRPYNDIPRRSKCMVLAQNRLWLGGNLRGYNTPTQTSLSVGLPATVPVSDTTATVTIYAFFHAGSNGTDDYAYGAYILINPPGRPGYFLIVGTEIVDMTSHTYPTLAPPPTTVSSTSLLEIGGTFIGAVYTTTPAGYGEDAYTGYPVGPISLTDFTTKALLKSGTDYRLGIVFYDEALRKCGVVTKDNLTISTPDRNYGFTYGYDKINWTLGGGDRPDEIPAWAKYYAVVATKNLRTRSFVQALATVLSYAAKDSSNNYVYGGTGFASNTVALAINIKGLVNTGLGYTFTEGDQCRIITTASVIYNVPVIGVFGEWIHLKPIDIGTLSSSIIYEVYTPYSPSEEEPFYEVGQILPVSDAGTDTRSYSTTAGTISPDVFAITRTYSGTAFIAEATCPNDNYYSRWDTDAGRDNYVTDLGEVDHTTEIAFSNVYTPGTQNNGLFTLEALNRQILPYELGNLSALVTASRVQSLGSVLLAIGTARAASIYVGMTELSDANGQTTLVKSTGVIGQINPLLGLYGCQHPESIVCAEGQVRWFSQIAKRFAVYYSNGLAEFSRGTENNYKFFQASVDLADALASVPTARIFGGFDPVNREFLWAVPTLSTARVALEDYTNIEEPPTETYVDEVTGDVKIASPYIFNDLQEKVLIFNPDANRWCGAYTFGTEGIATLAGDVYVFNRGRMFRCNVAGTTAYLTDQPYRLRIVLAANEGNVVKEFRSLSVESSHAPAWTHLQVTYPRLQSAHLRAAHFCKREGIWYGGIPCDRLTPGIPDKTLAMLTGYTLRGQVALIDLEFEKYRVEEPVWFRLAKVGFNPSSGHF